MLAALGARRSPLFVTVFPPLLCPPPPRHLEANFLQKLVPDATFLEPLANGCTEVLVWHMHVEANPRFRYPKGWVIPQPQNLVLAEKGSNWRFVVHGKRHAIANLGSRDIPFRYGR